MKTINRINKPIKFHGLTSLQFGVYLLVIAIIIIGCIFKQISPLIIVGIIGIIYFVSNIMFKNLIREHKAGNPDYLTGLTVKSTTPRKIVDKHKVFNHIIQKR